MSQDTSKFFITFLAKQVSFKTLKLYLAAVKLNNIELGYKDNVHKMAQLHLLLRALSKLLEIREREKTTPTCYSPPPEKSETILADAVYPKPR